MVFNTKLQQQERKSAGEWKDAGELSAEERFSARLRGRAMCGGAAVHGAETANVRNSPEMLAENVERLRADLCLIDSCTDRSSPRVEKPAKHRAANSP